MSAGTLDQLWQRERDLMDFAWQSSESAADRVNAIMLQKIAGDAKLDAIKLYDKLTDETAFGRFAGSFMDNLADEFFNELKG